MCERSPCDGQVHCRREILIDMDNFLGLSLSQEWMSMHDFYEIVGKVSDEKVVYDVDGNQSDKDKVLNYLTKAYFTAFSELIPPLDILLIIKQQYKFESLSTFVYGII